MARKNFSDRVYKNEQGKFKAVVAEIKARHERGQPVLVGTISIEKNEILSQMLEREGVPHTVLNAKNHEKEGEIIAQAGRLGAVTIATNMAGRGVDIILGGNPSSPEEAAKVCVLGGLHVLGTERHESRRIDNQLRGRSGRQGDPGSSQFYVSLEDDLMRIFAGDRVKGLMERFRIPDDMPIENGLVSRSIESAQTKVEQYNFDIRKHLIDYDDVLNKHRETIYKRRRDILKIPLTPPSPLRGEEKGEGVAGLKNQILDMIEREIEQVVSFHTSSEDEATWNLNEVYEVARTIFPLAESEKEKITALQNKAGDKVGDISARTEIIQYLKNLALSAYDDLEKRLIEHVKDDQIMRKVEKGMYLRSIDTLWIEHLDAMEHLRRGIGLRGYGQRDPLVEYKKESYRMFTELLHLIEKQVVYSIYKVGAATQIAPSLLQRRGISVTAPLKTMEKGRGLIAPPEEAGKGKAPVTQYQEFPKVGRNEPCPCGATKPDGTPKKYKHCHGANL